MPPKAAAPQARTIGSNSFTADKFIEQWDGSAVPYENRLDEAISKAFDLTANDQYVYHASVAVTLAQVQKAVEAGARNGLHAWYRDDEGTLLDAPSAQDIEAYTSIFSPKTSTTGALKGLASNAKKSSIRASVADHLLANFKAPATESKLQLPGKQKKITVQNPYLDYWAWSCQNLEWVGPDATTVKVRQSHHILPIFYHHFGCICPTWDALSLIDQLCKVDLPKTKPTTSPRPIVEIGSGNGYWAFLLRKMGLTLYAVDNALSAWRTTWIDDTIIQDGTKFLADPPAELSAQLGGKGATKAILLLVYPQVSDDLTGKFVRAYQGDVIVVAGTQNGNGFTGFKSETIAEWMARERKEFELLVQIPLPSFAGKDEAFFVFKKRPAPRVLSILQ